MPTMKMPFWLVITPRRAQPAWTCPGHNGGVFYSRSPVGRVFMEHLGERFFATISTICSIRAIADP